MTQPILLVGAPGVGKTEIIRSRYDYCEVLLLSSQTEEDIAGIPYQIDGNEKRTIPPFIQRLKEAKGSKCLFLDELDKARREVADTLLTLVTHPQHFGIPKDVDIVAACNPPEWGGGDGISQPMLNRFAVIDFKPDFGKWSEWIQSKYHDHDVVDKILHAIAEQQIPFLEQNGEGLNWRLTCPRTLEGAIKVIINQPREAHEIIPGLVTANAASGILRLISNTKSFHYKQDIARKTGSEKIKDILRL